MAWSSIWTIGPPSRVRDHAVIRTAIWLAASTAGALALASPALAGDTASAVLRDATGKEANGQPERSPGQPRPDSVPPGEHAFHIHAFGKCEPQDFKSAGPHFDPDQTRHGYLNPEWSHAGDMPNLHVPADGKLQVEILVPNVSLSDEAPLLDAEGSALVIHAGADDYKTDPAGNSGDRIACGVITP